MIKEYKLPGLYVLGVPEKSLISFVTFSLSFLVLTVSYLLYFYFRGCPVELALLPPVDKLGEPVEITFDAADELSGEDVAPVEENVAIDAVKSDPGEKPSLTARLFGIFKKTKVPEEVVEIDVPETQDEEDDMPLEEKASIKDKIVSFFQKKEVSEPVLDVAEDAPEEVQEEEISEEATETEQSEEEGSIKDKIVGFFSKAEGEVVQDNKPESEGIIPEDVPVDATVEEDVVDDATDEEQPEEENPTLTDKIVGFFKKPDIEEEIVFETQDEQEAMEMVEETKDLPIEQISEPTQDEIQAENSIKAVVQSFLGTKEESAEDTTSPEIEEAEEAFKEEEIDSDNSEIEGSCEDLPDDKTLREKIWNFFGCGEKEVASAPEESTETVEDLEDLPVEVEELLETVGESEDDEPETEASAEEEVEEESTSIKDKIVEFFHKSDETEDSAEDTTDQASLTEEIGEIEDNDEEVEMEGSCEDLPEDKSLREKIWNFFGCGEKEVAGVADEESETVDEPESLPAEVEDSVEAVDEEIKEEIAADNSIKAAVQNFLGTNKEETPKEYVEEPTISEEQVSEGIEATEEEGLATDESGKQQM